MLITKTAAAKRLGLSRPIIYALIEMGELEVITPIRREMVVESSIDDFIKNRKSKR